MEGGEPRSRCHTAQLCTQGTRMSPTKCALVGQEDTSVNEKKEVKEEEETNRTNAAMLYYNCKNQNHL